MERFNKTETNGKYKLFKNYFNENDRENTMKNFARLNVYIADSNVVKTQETEDYPTNQLVSDIGEYNLANHMETYMTNHIRLFLLKLYNVPLHNRYVTNLKNRCLYYSYHILHIFYWTD